VGRVAVAGGGARAEADRALIRAIVVRRAPAGLVAVSGAHPEDPAVPVRPARQQAQAAACSVAASAA
jgi:hypothetical protein